MVIGDFISKKILFVGNNSDIIQTDIQGLYIKKYQSHFGVHEINDSKQSIDQYLSLPLAEPSDMNGLLTLLQNLQQPVRQGDITEDRRAEFPPIARQPVPDQRRIGNPLAGLNFSSFNGDLPATNPSVSQASITFSTLNPLNPHNRDREYP